MTPISAAERRAIAALPPHQGFGGHHAAGTCQVPNDQAEKVLAEVISVINKDG